MTTELSALKEFLPKTPFFGGLDDEQLDRIIAMLVERRFAKGATVFNEGDTGRSMYIIQSGTLLLSKREGLRGHVKLLRLGVGDFFGETSLIAMHTRPSTVTAEQDAVLYELTNVNLYTLYQADVKAYVMVLQNMNRELCRRLRKSDERITEMADDAGDESTQIKPARTRSKPPTR
jgi:CRP-like cAMP-binding protein